MIDPLYFLITLPAMLLAMWAQFRIQSAYQRAQQEPAPVSGAAAARYILDSAGLAHVDIEMTPGQLSDHYDPAANVLRLSQPVYHGRNLAAVGIAAHEAGHAIQKAEHYAPLFLRNAAVPAANFGSRSAFLLVFLGLMASMPIVVKFGLALFGAVVFFQVVNLPVEFDASARAKRQLVQLGIVPEHEMGEVRAVLNAAAMTYVAGTLQAILTFVYLFMRSGSSRDE